MIDLSPLLSLVSAAKRYNKLAEGEYSDAYLRAQRELAERLRHSLPALESLLAQQKRLTALVEKWRSIDKGYPSEYIAANHDCADELRAVLEEGK